MKKATILTLLVLQGVLANALKVLERADIDLGPVDYQCPEGFYVAPHEIQCELYYICASGGTPTHMYHCDGDMLFDLQYYGCNFKELVDCGNRLEPFTCPQPDGQFPVKENACDSRYYICINNNATIMTCPGEGIYQPATQTCAAPGTVFCPTTTTPTVPTTGGPFVCPKPNGNFPSPYSCEQYYVCVDNTSFLFECPAGLHYNVAIDQCDYPASANCQIP